MHISIADIYREVVSGDTIASRPVMQQLLNEVEQGLWNGVFVMEVERLARGDTIDQGLVAQAFRYSNTKIITPMKTYDPSNEFDEEYFEFGLFMSRREYKTINRRLQRGRLMSVMEGKYVANRSPYGYNRVKIQNGKGFVLEIDENRAKVIRLIFDMFVNGEARKDGSAKRLGSYLIAKRLNEMKVESYTGKGWTQSSIRDILINPVYIGKIRWNWRKTVNNVVNGEKVTKRPRQDLDNCQIYQGLHPPIIDTEIWEKAQRIMKENLTPRTSEQRTTQNPLSGLIICGKCGRKMVRRPDSSGKTPPSLICTYTSCGNVSSYLHFVEEKIMASLSIWLEDYKIKLNIKNITNEIQSEAKARALRAWQTELENTEKQLDNLYDLLEQGIYDRDTFITRSAQLLKRKENNITAINNAQKELKLEKHRNDSKQEIVPRAENILNVYNEIETPLGKNQMLKEALDKVVYIKETGSRWHASPDAFQLILYPRLPKISSKTDNI